MHQVRLGGAFRPPEAAPSQPATIRVVVEASQPKPPKRASIGWFLIAPLVCWMLVEGQVYQHANDPKPVDPDKDKSVSQILDENGQDLVQVPGTEYPAGSPESYAQAARAFANMRRQAPN